LPLCLINGAAGKEGVTVAWQARHLDEVRRRVELQQARLEAAVVGRRWTVRDVERRKEQL
jgi:hypothetical protein